MKKLLIVNNNMKVGGVQKSLYNFLWATEKHYDITLLLFACKGAYMDKLPPGIKILECKSLFRYLGVSQGECKGSLSDALTRGFLAVICRFFGRPVVMRLLLASQKMLPESYDCAISFLHNGRRRAFYGGVQEFVLHRVKAIKKVAFLHCDYRSCGADFRGNNRSLSKFDAIAPCSDGCRRVFLEVLPAFEERCNTVKNFHRFEEIQALAEEDPVCYEECRFNVLMVSRLSHEKGVERAIKAIACAIELRVPVTLHIVGSGAMEEALHSLVDELGILEYVKFYGEHDNPYRFMKNADLFLLTSYHEAAPLVIEEAQYLKLPILTVNTTSSEDMVKKTGAGWVCDNSQSAIDRALVDILSNADALGHVKEHLQKQQMDNALALSQLKLMVD